jgi:hypothetical protein
VGLTKIAIIARGHWTAFIFCRVATPEKPIAPERRQTVLHVAPEIRVAPRTTRVVHAHGFVPLNLTGDTLRRRELNFPYRHAEIFVNCPGQINAFAVGQLGGAVKFEGIFGSDHKSTGELMVD